MQDVIGSKAKIRLRGGRAKEEGRVEVKMGDSEYNFAFLSIGKISMTARYLFDSFPFPLRRKIQREIGFSGNLICGSIVPSDSNVEFDFRF